MADPTDRKATTTAGQAAERIERLHITPLGAAGQRGSAFADVPLIPPDAIFHVKTAFGEDTDPDKVNLGIGAYRTEEGKPWVLPAVRLAEEELVADPALSHEYLPIRGSPAFIAAAQELVFADAGGVLADRRVGSMQCLSGTGALRMGFTFVHDHMPGATVYVSEPTWGNHKKVLGKCELEHTNYSYFDAETRGLGFEQMCTDLRAAPPGSVVLLHSCAHNPTGVDPTLEQWEALSDLFHECGLFPFFDTAYQGFASGDPDRDAAAIRLFVDRGHEMIVAQSFAKNMGLYGERTGALHVVSAEAGSVVKSIESQLAGLARPMYSNPPRHGAEIVTKVLTTPSLRAEWVRNIETMAERITSMRHALRDRLLQNGAPGNWDHIINQIGMFSFTGLTPAQTEAMRDRHHVYMLSNGRISVAGLNSGNVVKVADAIKDVVESV